MITKSEIIQSIIDFSHESPEACSTIFEGSILKLCESLECQELNLDDLEIRAGNLLASIRVAKKHLDDPNSQYSKDIIIANVKYYLNNL